MTEERYELITQLYHIGIEFKMYTTITAMNQINIQFIKPGQTHLHYVDLIYKQNEQLSTSEILNNLFTDF
jgi:hypothetical protein